MRLSLPRDRATRYTLYGVAATAGVVLVASIVAAVRRRSAGSFAYPSFITGRRLTHASADAEGFVRETPAALARQADLDIESSTLARFVGSEWGSGSAREKAAVAWAIVNRARRRGWTLLRMATTVCWGPRAARECDDTGLYGRQDMTAWRPGGNRYASTARDPTDRDGHVATMVLSGRWPDLTGGADQFFDPATQRILHARDPETYDTPEEVIARWTRDGDRRVYPTPAGVDPNELVLVGPA